jgi:tetratricopeptide (TPR) repeat protein
MVDQRQHIENDKSDRFLIDPPEEVGRLMKWFHAGARAEEGGTDLENFASAFLGALVHDHAVIPPMDVHPPKLLAWVLTHHIRNPENCAAWLNLGLALRLMARSDEEPRRNARLARSIECFDRSISLVESASPTVIRGWVGKALVFSELGEFERAVQCSREAVALDSSDPNLRLLESSMLSMAGRTEEALEVIQDAYDAFVIAGEPEELRHVFDSVPSVSRSERH